MLALSKIEHSAELAVRGDVHAIVAAVDVEADAEEVDHLAEGERDHDEIDAAGAQRDGADGKRCKGRRRDRDGEMQRGRR